jgi:cell division protease FtsH
MSDKIGQVYFAREKKSKFLNMMPEGAVDYSEATAELIDHEVKEIIDAQYAIAQEILKEHKQLLKKSVTVLLETETIEGDELLALKDELSAAGKTDVTAVSR